MNEKTTFLKVYQKAIFSTEKKYIINTKIFEVSITSKRNVFTDKKLGLLHLMIVYCNVGVALESRKIHQCFYCSKEASINSIIASVQLH